MIKKYIDRLFGRRDRVTHKDARPVIYGKDKHAIEREHISRCARRTCEELQRAGFLAFVVGGAVRDLLLGIRPKDFDVATNATPNEVRSAFRRSRIIGRRFQIVHVLCGADTVEVSTFRAHFAREPDEGNTDEHGRMLSDNVFGTQAEDALRRDFTVNALFYDPVKEEVWDYVHGLKDLKARKLVMIGDPATRYREDPVRMLRAARLGAKLGLEIDAKTAEPIRSLRHLVENVPQARLFEEILKLLLSGNAVDCIRVLRELDLHHGLLPLLDTALDDPETGPFAMAALHATKSSLAPTRCHRRRLAQASARPRYKARLSKGKSRRSSIRKASSASRRTSLRRYWPMRSGWNRSTTWKRSGWPAPSQVVRLALGPTLNGSGPDPGSPRHGRGRARRFGGTHSAPASLFLPGPRHPRHGSNAR